jgi:hypothetical protein
LDSLQEDKNQSKCVANSAIIISTHFGCAIKAISRVISSSASAQSFSGLLSFWFKKFSILFARSPGNDKVGGVQYLLIILPDGIGSKQHPNYCHSPLVGAPCVIKDSKQGIQNAGYTCIQ